MSYQSTTVAEILDRTVDLQAKLATLSMMPLNTYAEGLGVKAADSLYWVECDLNAPQRPLHAE